MDNEEVSEKMDIDNDGVSDKMERFGEMIFALMGVLFSMYAGVNEILEGWEIVIMMVVSFGLYQGTTMTKYISEIVKKG